MSVDVTVNTTETNVNINTSTIVETVDITATVQQDAVEIEVFPNVTVVNVTKKEGQDGQDLTLSDFSVAPEAETLNDADKFLIEQGGVWKSIEEEKLLNKFSNQIIANWSGYIVLAANSSGNYFSTFEQNDGRSGRIYLVLNISSFSTYVPMFGQFPSNCKKIQFDYEFTSFVGQINNHTQYTVKLYTADSMNGSVSLINKVEIYSNTFDVNLNSRIKISDIIEGQFENGKNIYLFINHNETVIMYSKESHFQLKILE